MNKRAGNGRSYMRAFCKGLGSENIKNHSSRPNLTYEECRPYPRNKKSPEPQAAYQRCIDPAYNPRTFEECSIAGGDNLDSWESKSEADEIRRSKVPIGDDLLIMPRRSTQHAWSGLHESMPDPSSPRQDDGFYVEYHCHFGRFPALQKHRKDRLSPESYASHTDLRFCQHCLEAEHLEYMDDDLIEDEATHPLLPSTIHLADCQMRPCFPDYHPGNMRMFGGLFEDEHGSLYRAQDNVPAPFQSSGSQFPMGQEYAEGWMAGMMAGVLATGEVFARELDFGDRFEPDFQQPEFDASQEHRFIDPIASEESDADLSDMQHMAFRKSMNAGPPPIHKRRALEYHLDKEAKSQLERYNKWWTDIHSRTKSAKPSLETILFLSPSTNPGQDWKWNAHEFFCLAFHLRPRSIPQQDTSPRLTFTPHPSSSASSLRTNLHALRAQLKLEKVRWHEDKLRSIFGDEIARDERSKAVWSAIIGLKGEVERVLERGS
ncbi:hypothetical protein EG329_008363 [Mollisiaceae sp. DMI_Dod_QoI]|nr:hypothetical protein EG329_008363 [Helotiales sp. DMI_Dod_QoI]